MGFNKGNYKRIKHEYEGKALRAMEDTEKRKKELHSLYPSLAKIDEELSLTGLKIFEATLKFKGEALEKKIDELKKENETLKNERKNELMRLGLPLDCTDVKYECEKCSDSGFVGLNMCTCMKEKLIYAGYESSGILPLIKEKSFENFTPELQKDEKSATNIRMLKDFCQKYAEGFSEKSPNLLFIGGTGLGKTHLCAAITAKCIGMGHDVLCETAQNLFSDFEFERFSRPYTKDEGVENRTDRYFDCDLLIIDDLGTEMSNQFTVSCLYNVINTRLNRGKPIIINTNLSRDDLKNRYSDRITSRLFGEFLPLMFFGRDVRELKLG